MSQYYANPNNQFWRIIYRVFEGDSQGASYDDKVRFLLDYAIALWDMFYSAEREGALDADIRNETPNDIPGLIQSFPCVKCILLNGRKAEKSFRCHFPDLGIDSVYVPSTSPAFARKDLEEKFRDWKHAIFLN